LSASGRVVAMEMSYLWDELLFEMIPECFIESKCQLKKACV